MPPATCCMAVASSFMTAFVEVVDDEGTKIYASRTKIGKSCNLDSGLHYPFPNSQCLFQLETKLTLSLPKLR
ncbi:hypothetical protein MC885_008594, partial [Smutsia gigantea]